MWSWVQKLEALHREAKPVAVVTVVSTSGSTPREVGAKMLVEEGTAFFGTIGGGQLEQLVLNDARACLRQRQSRSFRYPLGAKAGQCCGGVMEILVESLNVGPRLYLFGGGHVAQALCSVLQGTPFQVELVEQRPEWVEAEGLPSEVERHAEPWEDFVDTARWDAERTYVAVMTHRHDTDQDIVASLLSRPVKYLGLIGSDLKWKRFRERLLQRGFTEAQLDRVKCPIGIPLGGKAPKEVAISVAAELLAIHHGEEVPPSSEVEAKPPRSP